MCFPSVKTPEPVEIEKPVFVRNPFLDEDEKSARSASAIRRGRSSLVIPTGKGIGFSGAEGSVEAGAAGGSNAIGGPATSGKPNAGPGFIPAAPELNQDRVATAAKKAIGKGPF